MAKEITPAYSMPENDVLVRSRLFRDQLTQDLAAFTARYGWMNGAWVTAFDTDIEAADNFPTDIDIVLELEVKTGDVNVAMTQGSFALDVLNSFAELAFPNDAKRRTAFGQQYWAKAKRKTSELNEALETAHSRAEETEYKTALLAVGVGMLQADIDLLEMTADELETKDAIQELFKGRRKIQTRDRISLFNVVYNKMRIIRNLAQIVWAADEERKDAYNLEPSSGGGTETTTIIVRCLLPDPPDARAVGASVLIDGVPDPVVTDLQGEAQFAGTNFEEFVNIHVDYNGQVFNFPDKPINVGEENVIEVILA